MKRHRGLEALTRIGVSGFGGLHFVEEFPHDPAHDREEQILLRRDVVVDASDGDPDLASDLTQSGGLEPLLIEEPDRCTSHSSGGLIPAPRLTLACHLRFPSCDFPKACELYFSELALENSSSRFTTMFPGVRAVSQISSSSSLRFASMCGKNGGTKTKSPSSMSTCSE